MTTEATKALLIRLGHAMELQMQKSVTPRPPRCNPEHIDQLGQMIVNACADCGWEINLKNGKALSQMPDDAGSEGANG